MPTTSIKSPTGGEGASLINAYPLCQCSVIGCGWRGTRRLGVGGVGSVGFGYLSELTGHFSMAPDSEESPDHSPPLPPSRIPGSAPAPWLVSVVKVGASTPPPGGGNVWRSCDGMLKMVPGQKPIGQKPTQRTTSPWTQTHRITSH